MRERGGPSVKVRELPVSVLDVAAYILQKLGPITGMKLQKLVYYCQAWSLVWDEAPLFKEKIYAWANGPVVYVLFKKHQKKFTVASCPGGDSSKLSKTQRDTVDAIIKFYGPKPSQWLSDLSHSELPWREARGDTPQNERGFNEITLASMSEYYESLQKKA